MVKLLLKLKQDDGLECKAEQKNTIPVHLGSLFLSVSKRFMNNFIREINGFTNNNVYYIVTDSLFIEKSIGMY